MAAAAAAQVEMARREAAAAVELCLNSNYLGYSQESGGSEVVLPLFNECSTFLLKSIRLCSDSLSLEFTYPPLFDPDPNPDQPAAPALGVTDSARIASATTTQTAWQSPLLKPEKKRMTPPRRGLGPWVQGREEGIV